MKLYAVRDRKTGKLVNNITNPKRRFWEDKYRCENACRCPNPYQFTGDKNDLEMVEFELVEDQEPKTKGEYIRKSDVINMVSEMLEDEWGYDGIKDDVESIVSKIPSFNAAPVVHGEWIDYLPVSGDSNLQPRCSQCELTNDAKTNFCPNCGADMRGDNHD